MELKRRFFRLEEWPCATLLYDTHTLFQTFFIVLTLLCAIQALIDAATLSCCVLSSLALRLFERGLLLFVVCFLV